MPRLESTIDARAAALETFEVRNLANQLAAAEAVAGATSSVQPLEAATVRARAAELFTNGEAKLHFSSGPKLAEQTTMRLVKLCKEARDELFTLHRAEINDNTGEQLTIKDARCAS